MIARILAAVLASSVPAEITVKPFPGLDREGRPVGCMTMTSGAMLFGTKGFGGISGLDLDEDENILWMLTDTGLFFSAGDAIDGEGRLNALSSPAMWRLVDPLHRGQRLDTESLTRSGDVWLVTRERLNDLIEVSVGADTASIVRTLADLSDADVISSNKGFEAAALMGDSRVLLIAEAKDENGHAPIYILTDGTLDRAGRFQGAEDHAVTDIAIDEATDRLFILERAFSRARGPRARISILPLSLAMASNGGVLTPIELGRLRFFDGVDNMEGMDFYHDDDGRGHLIVISDDNFSDIQRTVIMTLALGPGCALAPAKP